MRFINLQCFVVEHGEYQHHPGYQHKKLQAEGREGEQANGNDRINGFGSIKVLSGQIEDDQHDQQSLEIMVGWFPNYHLRSMRSNAEQQGTSESNKLASANSNIIENTFEQPVQQVSVDGMHGHEEQVP